LHVSAQPRWSARSGLSAFTATQADAEGELAHGEIGVVLGERAPLVAPQARPLDADLALELLTRIEALFLLAPAPVGIVR